MTCLPATSGKLTVLASMYGDTDNAQGTLPISYSSLDISVTVPVS